MKMVQVKQLLIILNCGQGALQYNIMYTCTCMINVQ